MEVYKVVVAHEKKGGKIKTKNFYFDKPKDAQSACKYLIHDYKNDERTNTYIEKVSLSEESLLAIMKAKRFFTSFEDFKLTIAIESTPTIVRRYYETVMSSIGSEADENA